MAEKLKMKYSSIVFSAFEADVLDKALRESIGNCMKIEKMGKCDEADPYSCTDFIVKFLLIKKICGAFNIETKPLPPGIQKRIDGISKIIGGLHGDSILNKNCNN